MLGEVKVLFSSKPSGLSLNLPQRLKTSLKLSPLLKIVTKTAKPFHFNCFKSHFFFEKPLCMMLLMHHLGGSSLPQCCKIPHNPATIP